MQSGTTRTINQSSVNNMNNETFRRHLSNRRFLRGQRKAQRPKIPDKLAVTYHIRITSGDEIVKELNSAFEIPQIQDPNYLAGPAADFPQLFDMLVSKPLATAVALFQAHREECQNQTDHPVGSAQGRNVCEPQPEFKSPQLPMSFQSFSRSLRLLRSSR